MTASKYPMLGMMYDDETGQYIAKLERRVTLYQLTELKMCALLELLTDEQWDTESILLADNDEMKRIASQAFQKRLKLSPTDAAALVEERWDKWNPTPAPPANPERIVQAMQTTSPEAQELPPTFNARTAVAGAMARKRAKKQDATPAD